MDKEKIAFCGLNCQRCQDRFAEIRSIAKTLQEKLDAINMSEVAKQIPFMKNKYKGYQKFLKFFESECPGCRNGGGNPFCGIRKCGKKNGFFTCAECESFCKKLDPIIKVHTDKELTQHLNIIREIGIDEFISQERYLK